MWNPFKKKIANKEPKNHEMEITMFVQSFVYFDSIRHLDPPIHAFPGDTINIVWNMKIELANDPDISSKPMAVLTKHVMSRDIKYPETINYVRLTHSNFKGVMRTYEHLPDGLPDVEEILKNETIQSD